MTPEAEPPQTLKDRLSPEEYTDRRNKFIMGCIKIVGRGDRIPDDIMRAIASEFELLKPLEPNPPENSSQDI